MTYFLFCLSMCLSNTNNLGLYSAQKVKSLSPVDINLTCSLVINDSVMFVELPLIVMNFYLFWSIGVTPCHVKTYSFSFLFQSSFSPILKLIAGCDIPAIHHWSTWALANLCNVDGKYFLV